MAQGPEGGRELRSPPCALCADRHARHFKIWAPLTRSEVAMMVLLALWLGVMIGWWAGFELQAWQHRTMAAEGG